MSEQSWKNVKRYKDAIISGDSIASMWSIEDVKENSLWTGEPITDEQAREVLSLLHYKHDANVGINWETIYFWTDYVVNG